MSQRGEVQTPRSGNCFIVRIVQSEQAVRAGEEIRVTQPIVIGRDPECGVVLADALVSRRHARLEATDQGLKVVDLGSGNGVWVGADRVQERVLSAGDQFRLGGFEGLADGEAVSLSRFARSG